MLALRIGRIEVAFETITVCHGLLSCLWPTNHERQIRRWVDRKDPARSGISMKISGARRRLVDALPR